jgi:hypothetical protein
MSFFKTLFFLFRILSRIRFNETACIVPLSAEMTLIFDSSGSIRLDMTGDLRVNANCFYFNCEDREVDSSNGEETTTNQSRGTLATLSGGREESNAGRDLLGVSYRVPRLEASGQFYPTDTQQASELRVISSNDVATYDSQHVPHHQTAPLS